MNLEEEYRDILKLPLIEVEVEYPTIFDISRYPHYENVISNWYEFFLNAANPHGFEDLFYSSLRQLLKQEYDPNACEVIREYTIDNGKRIDLLVHEGEESSVFSRPIIIENKIYAELYNRLDEYRNGVKSDDEKKCIVLCLHIGDGANEHGFDEITHQQYIDKIKENLPGYILKADVKYLNLLLDFMENIERMSRMETMSEDSKFYFENSEKIEQLVNMREKANLTVINNAYASVGNGKRDNWKWGRSKASEGSFNITVGDTGAWYYIKLSGLSYEIKLWMNDDLYYKWSSMDETAKSEVYEILKNSGGIEKEFNNNRYLATFSYALNNDSIDTYHEKILNTISGKWEKIFSIINASSRMT